MSEAETLIILLSLKVALVATLFSLPLALALAWALAKPAWPGRALLDSAVHLPLVLPPVVTGYLLLIAFGRDGVLGQALAALGVSVLFSWQGAAIAAALMSLPLLVRPIRQALEAVDPRLPAAARTLGASRRRAFMSITLPLAVPGVLAGAVLGFAKALGEFGATITFVSSIPGETQTLPLAIYAALQVPGQEGVAARLSLMAVALAVAALLLSEWLARRARRYRA
ncbi:molybdate ABC transporter permease subunit [Sandaracinobacteroides saxicola]|uniref:Molybdenum transport system permease n=1 Tax=Sandaracinobacteroides saxicola TaxID=2759707 RepID=A0A7G5IF28_9SPHN|nr:molybdate ABC transporter permease subunit [Sandaracinobacteroides saxicola]QMW21970.1 molybdate ABC transporter permease subunit [Sandaracinobacteroides saxicola]